MKRYVLVSLLAMLLGFSSLAGATLFGMGDGTIYDNDTQLTWLKDGNIFGTYKYGRILTFGLIPWTLQGLTTGAFLTGVKWGASIFGNWGLGSGKIRPNLL